MASIWFHEILFSGLRGVADQRWVPPPICRNGKVLVLLWDTPKSCGLKFKIGGAVWHHEILFSGLRGVADQRWGRAEGRTDEHKDHYIPPQVCGGYNDRYQLEPEEFHVFTRVRSDSTLPTSNHKSRGQSQRSLGLTTPVSLYSWIIG